MKQKPKVIAIAGPSASGKTALAVQVAQKYSGEIISADSRYIYKEIDIATAKPTEEEKQSISHYLIDICDVTEEYSAGRFVKDADFYIKDITERGKIPIVVGGTGLYFRSLRGTFDIPEILPDKKFRQEAENISNETLYKELSELNPEMASKIHPNNKVKIVRALEIARANVKPTFKECPYDIFWICLNAKDRDFLYEKANSRVDKMFEKGLLQEAENLFNKYGKNQILMNTIGIKELYDVIFNCEDIENAKNLIKQNTRRYIKRQISWFNGEKDINTVYIDDSIKTEEKVLTLIDELL